MCKRVTAISKFSRLDTLLAWLAIFLYKMGDKIRKAKMYFDGITAPSSSRWGAFTSLLALSALFIALGGWARMNAMVWVGFGIGVLALILAAYWLITGSKDKTATKGDINTLVTKITNLANEIKLERESRERENKSTRKKIKRQRERIRRGNNQNDG